MNKQLAIGAALLLFGTGVVGCSNTAEGAKEDTAKAADATAKAANDAGNAVKDTAKTAADATEKAGTAVVAGTEHAADAAGKAIAGAGEAATVTPKVKAALLADADLGKPDNATINVDTKDGKVVLRGSVKTNDFKKKAETITKKTLDEAKYTNPIVNQLTVGAH